MSGSEQPPLERKFSHAERQLYVKLLELSAHTEAESFLDEALQLLCTITGAHCGYLGIGTAVAAPTFMRTKGFASAQVSVIRSHISQGIIAQSLSTGRTIATASAMDDPRFSENRSVQAAKIEAVLCAPIGEVTAQGTQAGVVYLQGRDKPGPFTEYERKLLELFARHVAPITERILHSSAESSTDYTLSVREKLQVSSLVGRSHRLAKMFQQMIVANTVEMTVLLTGESGTGKTEVARCLHASSSRSKGPFVALNCAAIPELLFESELFGAEKGAHSQALKRMVGKIEAAQHGTLFLDEVAELPLALQAKLLQFLQDKTYFRLGATQPLTADVRLIAATNAELAELVRAKRFREDLLYRLDVFAIHLSPLRERREDVALIAERVLASQAIPAVAAATPSARALTLTWEARASLTRAEWPGNVRQLAGCVQRAAAHALADGSDVVDVQHLWPDSAPSVPVAAASRPTGAQQGIEEWDVALRRFQREYLSSALAHTKWNVTETARTLGLARSHLYELIRSHGLSRNAPNS